MVTSCQVLPASCVTARPFHTQPGEDAGLRSLLPTTTFFGSVGLTAAHISSFEPGVWLPRATHACCQLALRACSAAPSVQSSCQPSMAGLAGVPIVEPGLAAGWLEQPARTTRATATRGDWKRTRLNST